MRKVSNKHAKVAITLIIGLVILSGAAYLGRGWLRRSVIPAYATIFYKSSVDKAYSTAIPPVNERLKQLNVEFDISKYDECWRGDATQYEGFRETEGCTKNQFSKPLNSTSDFITEWQRESPGFEEYLLSTGWHKDSYGERPISIEEIFTRSSSQGTLTVNYSKNFGKTRCSLLISNSPGQTDSFYAYEACERDLVIFGGYPY